MTAPRICVVGSANIDLTFRTPRLPQPGETLAGSAFQLGFGGKGANQAVMAARLGGQVSLVGKVGADVFGTDMLRHLQEEGIDTTYLDRADGPATGVAAIIVDDEARNCILVVGGANLALTPEDVRRAAPAICDAAVLLGQLEVPLETILEAFRLARAHGVRTILNPAPAADLPDELLRLADVCVPNETEIEQLTGLPATSPEEAEAAAQVLRQRGVKEVIVTLGDRGVLWVGQRVEMIPAVPVTAVDPTGAGDALIGSLGVFLGEGRPLPEALRLANATAALSVSRPGAQTSFPGRAELKGFLHIITIFPFPLAF